MQLSPQQQQYLEILKELHENWTPHKGQIEAGRPIINGSKTTVFLQCGRKWGKTEYAAYLLWRHALLHPNSACYYVAPETTHGKEVIWSDGRLQNFGPEKYKKSVNNTELRIRFHNGSFIKIIGSENYGAANGLRPSFLVYDEFKEFNRKFHDVMNPNRAVYKAPLVIIGTPPRNDDCNYDQYIEFAEECKYRTDSLWVRQDSFTNPHIDVAWLNEEKQKLHDRGDADVWYREYEGKIVAGGRSSIFPMFERSLHVFPHQEILKQFKRDFRRFEWVLSTDPGTTTIFAGLFIAIHPLTRQVLVLDEIYESERRETSTMVIIPKFKEKFKDLYPDGDFEEDLFKSADEAAAWFINEAAVNCDLTFMPTQKHLNKKEDGISLIKDLLTISKGYDKKAIYISDRCGNLIREMELYATDANGKIPKKNDHLIDCLRYAFGTTSYDVNEVREAVIRSERRGYTIEEDIRNAKTQNWTEIFDKGFVK